MCSERGGCLKRLSGLDFLVFSQTQNNESRTLSLKHLFFSSQFLISVGFLSSSGAVMVKCYGRCQGGVSGKEVGLGWEPVSCLGQFNSTDSYCVLCVRQCARHVRQDRNIPMSLFPHLQNGNIVFIQYLTGDGVIQWVVKSWALESDLGSNSSSTTKQRSDPT